MFIAYNLKEKRDYVAAESFVKFVDPHKEEWQCCNQENCTHIKVVPVVKHIRKGDYVTAHFKQHSLNELKCNNTNESDRHFNTKMHILSLVYEKDLKFKIGELILQYTEENIEGTEKLRKNRRADILLEFEKFNPILGKGLAIEIITTENEQSIRNKTKDWLINGYSIAWLYTNYFKDYKLTTDTIEIQYPYLNGIYSEFEKLNEKITSRFRELEKWGIEIDNQMQVTVNNLKAQLTYDKEKIVEEITNKTRTSCRSCKNSSPDKESDLLCCWKNYRDGTQKFPDKVEPNYSCKFWASNIQEGKE